MREILVLAALAGCTMAPKHVRPEAPVPEAWPAAAGGAGESATATDWRAFFPDPQLQTLIAAALEHNRDLRAAALRIEEARALHRIRRSELGPPVQGNAGASVSHTPASISPFGEAFTIRSYQVGVSIPAWEIDVFGRIRSLTGAALARYLATEEAHAGVRISLVAEVASAWLAERAAAEQLALAEQTLAARTQAHELAEQRFAGGVSDELELRQSETLVAQAEVAVAVLTRQRGQANNALTLLVGTSVAELPPAVGLSEQQIRADLPVGMPSAVLQQRPDIRAAEHEIRAANGDIGAARAAFFPRISLTAAAGTASRELLGLFGGGTASWSFAPQLAQPIFAWGRNRANLRAVKVRKELAVVAYERAIQAAFREVADALVARETFDAQIAAQERLREAQQTRLELAQQRYDNGITSFLEVLDAQRALFDAEQALVQARQQRLVNAVDLYRALGGGIEPETTAGG